MSGMVLDESRAAGRGVESGGFDAAGFYERYWAHREARGDVAAANRVKLRHEQAAAYLRRAIGDQGGAAVLDVGCGDGVLGEVLGKAGVGWRVTGVDLAERAVELAAGWYERVRRFDLDRDAVPAEWRGAFDGVACLEVLEHVEEPRAGLGRVAEMVRPGGAVVVSFPNLFSWRNRLAFAAGRWPAGYTTYDPREHLHVLELRQVRRWMAEAGVEVTGVAITPELPRREPLRRWMFRMRGLLGRVGPTVWAMQIAVFGRKRGNAR